MMGEGGGAAPHSAAEEPTPLDEAPELGPGLATGAYDLVDAKLPSPWVRTVVGFLPPTGQGRWAGTLWRLGLGVTARLEATGRGEAASGKLRIGGAVPVESIGARVGPEEYSIEMPAARVDSISARVGPDVGGEPGTVLTFPPVTVEGREVALVAEVGHTAQAGARVFIAQDTCRQATVKSGEDEIVLRFVESPESQGPAGAMLWIDTDGDGEAAEWEVASVGVPLGFAGRLHRFHLDRPEAGKLTIEAYDGEVGVVSFDATDGQGKPSGVHNPGFSTSAGSVQYLGVVTTAEVPAGEARLVYGLPVSPTSMALAASDRPVNIPAGGAVEVKAGGPVEIMITTSASRGGDVTADMRLVTATGHTVGGYSGPEEGSGVVEVVGPDGDVVAVGKAEFG